MVTHVTAEHTEVLSAREHLGGGCREAHSSPRQWEPPPPPQSLPTPLPASTELISGPEALPFAHRCSAFLRPSGPARVCLGHSRVLSTHVLRSDRRRLELQPSLGRAGDTRGRPGGWAACRARCPRGVPHCHLSGVYREGSGVSLPKVKDSPALTHAAGQEGEVSGPWDRPGGKPVTGEMMGGGGGCCGRVP